MTRDETIELIKVMQAFVNGKTVQWLDSKGIWWDDSNPTFRPAYKWRIKQGPRKIWELRDKDGVVCCRFQEKETAKKFANEYGYIIHEYREVMPGEST